jgi:hypothetical protein
LLKLLFNPNAIINALHAQAEINKLNLDREEAQVRRRMEMESLYYEIIHNLVFELTRSGIEVKNLKMRVESLASRLEFNERRARALESAVVYRTAGDEPPEPVTREARQDVVQPPSPVPAPPMAAPGTLAAPLQPSPAGVAPPEGPGQRSRRRRRRRGRRSGAPASTVMGEPTQQDETDESSPAELEAAEETADVDRPSAETPSDDGNHSTGSGSDPDQQ